MTIAEAERFYDQDKHNYELKRNKEFLRWLNTSIDGGYSCFISIDGMQDLIDYLVEWYEIKYPENELKFYEGKKDISFKDIRSISHSMNLRQLLFRLTNKQLSLMECGYRARGWGQHTIYKDGKIVGQEDEIFLSINKKDKKNHHYYWDRTPHFFLNADYFTGKVKINNDIKEYTGQNEDLILDEVLEIFKNKYKEELDYTELEEIIYNHNTDIELRHRILQLVALKLIYSKNTIPSRGYIRAKRFINEFNKKMDLTLSTEEIDVIMNRDYTNGEKWELDINKSTSPNGVNYSVVTVKNKAKNETDRGIKKLVKNIIKIH